MYKIIYNYKGEQGEQVFKESKTFTILSFMILYTIF